MNKVNCIFNEILEILLIEWLRLVEFQVRIGDEWVIGLSVDKIVYQ